MERKLSEPRHLNESECQEPNYKPAKEVLDRWSQIIAGLALSFYGLENYLQELTLGAGGAKFIDQAADLNFLATDLHQEIMLARNNCPNGLYFDVNFEICKGPQAEAPAVTTEP